MTTETTCRHCGTALTYRSHAYVDANGSRVCSAWLGLRHAPAPMRTSDLLDLVYGDEGRDDPLTRALRRAGN